MQNSNSNVWAGILIALVIAAIIGVVVFSKKKEVNYTPVPSSIPEVTKDKCQPPLSAEEWDICFPSNGKE